jgi:hypothetical protein
MKVNATNKNKRVLFEGGQVRRTISFGFTSGVKQYSGPAGHVRDKPGHGGLAMTEGF